MFSIYNKTHCPLFFLYLRRCVELFPYQNKQGDLNSNRKDAKYQTCAKWHYPMGRSWEHKLQGPRDKSWEMGKRPRGKNNQSKSSNKSDVHISAIIACICIFCIFAIYTHIVYCIFLFLYVHILIYVHIINYIFQEGWPNDSYVLQHARHAMGTLSEVSHWANEQPVNKMLELFAWALASAGDTVLQAAMGVTLFRSWTSE